MGNFNSTTGTGLSQLVHSNTARFAQELLDDVTVPETSSDTADYALSSQQNDVLPTPDQLPFENLVFEGGGSKGVAYCGALKYLEKVGLLDPNGNHRIKRFAGTSAGAITASLLAVGYSADEIAELYSPSKIKSMTSGSMFSVILRVGNIIHFVRNYGFMTSMPVCEELEMNIKKKTANGNITFKELYDKTGKELCVIVTNLNKLSVEYFHPKTTPDTKISEAVRMSMTIPGYFAAVKAVIGDGNSEDLFVDGGVLCNYPIHCFDGWFLSMKESDSFIVKIRKVKDIPKLFDQSERFGTFNKKTLGLLVYSDTDREWMKHYFDRRNGVLEPAYPVAETKLSKSRKHDKRQQPNTEMLYNKTMDALSMFATVAREYNIQDKGTLSKEEFIKIFNDSRLTPTFRRILFQDLQVDDAFNHIDKDKSGKLSYQEIVRFTESLGICLQNKYIGFSRGNINSFKSFIKSIISAMLANSKLVFMQAEDRYRTIGINTGHVGTLDFDLEDGDIEFLKKRGENAANAFMVEYISQNNKKN